MLAMSMMTTVVIENGTNNEFDVVRCRYGIRQDRNDFAVSHVRTTAMLMVSEVLSHVQDHSPGTFDMVHSQCLQAEIFGRPSVIYTDKESSD